MREIKFRGKRVDNGEWVYGYLVKNTITTRIISDFALVRSDAHTEDSLNHCSGYFDIVDTETVGQFTGLTDKNGKDIYEGDIVHCKGYGISYIGERKTYRVAYNESAEFELINTQRNTYSDKSFGYSTERILTQHSFEVIGNVYDNPELIK